VRRKITGDEMAATLNQKRFRGPIASGRLRGSDEVRAVLAPD
jgi:regulator of RNase E activity RraA